MCKKKVPNKDSSRRSAEQVEVNIKQLRKIHFIIKRDQTFISEKVVPVSQKKMGQFNDLKNHINEYIKAPGNKAINKQLQNAYDGMELDVFKDEDLAKEQESKEEREKMIKTYIYKKDEIQPDFEPIDTVD